MSKIYDIEFKIKESLKLYNDPSSYFVSKILDNCPVERKMFFPGKLYVFKYKPEKTTNLYDSRPYIMSLGPDKEKPNLFYGINMHHMPYKIRLQFFTYIYDIMNSTIEKEISYYPEINDAVKQKYIIELNSENVTKIPFNVKPSINQYNIQYISNCHLINYNLIHFMLQSDDDYFVNGSIAKAQDKFMKHILKMFNR